MARQAVAAGLGALITKQGNEPQLSNKVKFM
jgi:hypothetical protein